MLLTKEEIKKLIEESRLIENFINLDIQLTPNGFDLTAQKIFKFILPGSIDFSNKERVISEVEELLPQKKKEEKYGWWYLSRGAYKVKTNEILNLPSDLVAIGFPRTSLLRSGVFIQNGVWDAGFSGRSEFILVVENPFGVKIKENARLLQIIFFRVKNTQNYQGIYKDLR